MGAEGERESSEKGKERKRRGSGERKEGKERILKATTFYLNFTG